MFLLPIKSIHFPHFSVSYRPEGYMRTGNMSYRLFGHMRTCSRPAATLRTNTEKYILVSVLDLDNSVRFGRDT